MKHFFCVAFVLVQVVGYLHAQETPRFIELKGHSFADDVLHYVSSIVWSHDGKRVGTVGMDGTVRVWNAETGKELRKLKADTMGTSSVSFSLTGETIAMINPLPERAAFIQIWDVESGKELQRSLDYASKSLFDVFPHLTKKLATGHVTVRIWDADSGKELQQIGGRTEGGGFSIFSPDGKKIVTAAGNGVVQIWDAESGKELPRLREQKRGIYARSVAFSMGGKKVATIEHEGIVRIWEVDSGKELKKLESFPGDWHWPAAFSPDEKKIVAVGTTTDQSSCVRILDTESGKVQELKIPEVRNEYVTLKPANFFAITFSPDGKSIAIAGDYGFAGIWVLE